MPGPVLIPTAARRDVLARRLAAARVVARRVTARAGAARLLTGVTALLAVAVLVAAVTTLRGDTVPGGEGPRGSPRAPGSEPVAADGDSRAGTDWVVDPGGLGPLRLGAAVPAGGNPFCGPGCDRPPAEVARDPGHGCVEWAYPRRGGDAVWAWVREATVVAVGVVTGPSAGPSRAGPLTDDGIVPGIPVRADDPRFSSYRVTQTPGGGPGGISVARRRVGGSVLTVAARDGAGVDYAGVSLAAGLQCTPSAGPVPAAVADGPAIDGTSLQGVELGSSAQDLPERWIDVGFAGDLCRPYLDVGVAGDPVRGGAAVVRGDTVVALQAKRLVGGPQVGDLAGPALAALGGGPATATRDVDAADPWAPAYGDVSVVDVTGRSVTLDIRDPAPVRAGLSWPAWGDAVTPGAGAIVSNITVGRSCRSS